MSALAAQVHRILSNGKALMLAYDHGFEHGPKDFNVKTIDPSFVFDVALEAGFTGIVVHAGIAEKYYNTFYRDVPLIVKLNGHTRLGVKPLISSQVCSVERAIKLGADAVGYTIYPGSHEEHEMLEEAASVVEKAHDYGLPVILWSYPRGNGVEELNTDVIAYAARLGLELGADFVKLKYNHDREGFKWVLKSAGRAKVLVAGGERVVDEEFLSFVKEALSIGVSGFVVGRNIFQNPRPFTIGKLLRALVIEGKPFETVLERLHNA